MKLGHVIPGRGLILGRIYLAFHLVCAFASFHQTTNNSDHLSTRLSVEQYHRSLATVLGISGLGIGNPSRTES